MQNNFFKSVGKSAKDEAIKAAKQMRGEPGELLKTTGKQFGLETNKVEGPSMMQQVMTGDGQVKDVSPIEEQAIAIQTKRRLQEIEAELRQLRQQREQKSIDWQKQQNELLGIGMEAQENKQKQTEQVVAPHTPTKGPKGPQQAKKGSMEIGRQHKG